MFKKLSCLLFVFAFSLMARAEDIQSVISYYKPDMSKGFIFISKADMTLSLVNSQGKTVVTYPMACGRVKGQKKNRGDNRTPEGHFLLQNIHDASSWGHDFRDGKGFIKHAYGPWFLRLQTGFPGIGIHGTHAPQSIGTRASEGCIRLENQHVEALKQKVTIGMPVIIGPEEGVQMLIASNIPSPRTPGSKGLTSAAISNTTVAAVTTWETSAKAEPVVVAEPEAAVDPVTPAGVKIVEGMLDVEPETDLTVVVPEENQPETTVAVSQPEEATAEPAVTTESEEHPEVTTETAQESVTTEPETAVSEPVSGEPHYEVVVEEVTGPDGEVKFEVRYKLVQ